MGGMADGDVGEAGLAAVPGPILLYVAAHLRRQGLALWVGTTPLVESRHDASPSRACCHHLWQAPLPTAEPHCRQRALHSVRVHALRCAGAASWAHGRAHLARGVLPEAPGGLGLLAQLPTQVPGPAAGADHRHQRVSVPCTAGGGGSSPGGMEGQALGEVESRGAGCLLGASPLGGLHAACCRPRQ